jgi:DNA-binding NarL/FixJ family response regulator
MRILLTDDYDLMRLGLRRFLEVTFKGALIEEALNAQQTRYALKQHLVE